VGGGVTGSATPDKLGPATAGPPAFQARSHVTWVGTLETVLGLGAFVAALLADPLALALGEFGAAAVVYGVLTVRRARRGRIPARPSAVMLAALVVVALILETPVVGVLAGLLAGGGVAKLTLAARPGSRRPE
jgi:hypothetical protein